jgi:NADH dehydrogenase
MKIVILGGGYAGILTAKALEKELKNHKDVNITLIDKNPYHTLLTQLHEVAGGRVKPSAVRVPYDMIFGKSSVEIVLDEVKTFDFSNHKLLSDEHSYDYDFLVIGTGSRPDFFGIDGVERYGYKLWSYKEAVTIRSMIYEQFEIASQIGSPAKRRERLNFVIAGGGFTGVEFAGELASWKKRLCKHFKIDPSEVGIYLVEATSDILNVITPSLRKKSKRYLEKLGVEVLTNSAIEKMEDNRIILNNGSVITGSLIWTAGIKGNPYIQKSDIQYDERRHWINVNQYLQSLSYENVFSVGDSLFYIYNDRPIPKVVETCMQSAALVAKNIKKLIDGKVPVPFQPKYHGSLVSIGPFYAVAKIGAFRFKWLFATGLKHFTNIHYLYSIGGIKLKIKYLQDQFIDRFLNRKEIS